MKTAECHEKSTVISLAKQFYKFDINIRDIDKVSSHIANHLIIDNREYQCNDHNNDNKFLFTLVPGKYECYYDSTLIKVNFIREPKVIGTAHDARKYEKLYLSISANCVNDAKKILKDIINCAEKAYAELKTNTIMSRYYDISCNYWSAFVTIKKRTIDTIFCDEEMKSVLISDIKKFKNNKDIYQKFGISYKRVYLFNGPPGTGKTSMVLALASLFNYDLSTITYSTELDDFKFMKALKTLNKNSILLLEDLDKMFDQNSPTKHNVTLSCLLNFLDGISRIDELIVFITANDINKLDEAIKRPGRVDCITTFEYPSITIIEKMFNTYFPSQTKNFKLLKDTLSDNKVSIALLQKFFIDNYDTDDITKQLPSLKKLISYYKKNDNSMYL